MLVTAGIWGGKQSIWRTPDSLVTCEQTKYEGMEG